MDDKPDDALGGLFSTSSGEPIGDLLLGLLTKPAQYIDRKNVMSVAIVMVDADGAAARAVCTFHPLAGAVLSARMRAAADEIDSRDRQMEAPENNRSFRVN